MTFKWPSCGSSWPPNVGRQLRPSPVRPIGPPLSATSWLRSVGNCPCCAGTGRQRPKPG
ncbi:hypothetical protein ACFFX0_25480 [Citricoccus parietis]|uniref:Uncharacterized protein n=1 Tax=Citricoccus parietis TaxID=592307 RepID=A0ABV5G637_9MICC